jgi:hypothetical protein
MRTTQLLILLLLSAHVFAGNGEDLGGRWTPSTYTINKTSARAGLKADVTELNIEFKCKEDKCLLKDIKMSIDGDRQIEAKLNSKNVLIYKMNSGKHVLTFWATGLNSCTTDTIDFKGQTLIQMTVEFTVRQRMVTRKPVIYLYPKKKQAVSIKLNYNGQLDFTYPTYNNGWNVTANPDGTIENNEKKYNYLFWDGKMETDKLKFDVNKGFVVKSTELTSFLDSTLTLMGLNSKETADFITYWVPDMMKNEKNYIHFLINKEYDQIAKVKVRPEPESMLRVFMLWNAVESENAITPTPQHFTKSNRNGFTYIEWGGSELIPLSH